MVTIRPWKWGDNLALAALINNRKIWDTVRDQLPHPYSVKDADSFIRYHIDRRPVTNFAILYHGQVAGGIGYIPKEDVYRLSAEIGYWVGEPFWGRGIATSAIGLMVQAVKGQSPDIIRIYAEVFSHNPSSMRALEKNGFGLESVRKRSVVKNGQVMDDHVYVLFTDQPQ
jgi:[ribosomal protein S5]-alanine N-acetyltransferase